MEQAGDSVASLTGVEACTVPGCNVDLSQLSSYHRRHRVCQVHLKTPQVQLNGQLCRFCQQCGRFQPLSDFQDTRRSCKAALQAHNERRRQNTIASDNALAQSRFRTSSTSSSRSRSLGAQRLSSSSSSSSTAAGQRSAWNASLAGGSAYDTQGAGVLRRPASNPVMYRKVPFASQQSWSGTLSDAASSLQQQQQQQLLKVESPTDSSYSTAGFHTPNPELHPRPPMQQRQSMARRQGAHQRGFATQQQQQQEQQQQMLQAAYVQQHGMVKRHSGCNPAVARIDALELLQAISMPAAAAVGSLDHPAHLQQMQCRGTIPQQQRGSAQRLTCGGGMPGWHDCMAPSTSQQQQLLLQGLPTVDMQDFHAAANILPGCQQQQQQYAPSTQGLPSEHFSPLWRQQQQEAERLMDPAAAAAASILQGWQGDLHLAQQQQQRQYAGGAFLPPPAYRNASSPHMCDVPAGLPPKQQQQATISPVGWAAAAPQPVFSYSLAHADMAGGQSSLAHADVAGGQSSMTHADMAGSQYGLAHADLAGGQSSLAHANDAAGGPCEYTLSHAGGAGGPTITVKQQPMYLASGELADCTLPGGVSGQWLPQQQQTQHQRQTVCQPASSQLGYVEYGNAAAGVQQQGSSVQALCRAGDATFAQDATAAAAAAAAAAAGLTCDVADLSATSPTTPASSMGPVVTPSAPVITLHNDLLPVDSDSWDCGPPAAAAAAAPDRLSFDDLDALLEHALSDFCAAQPDLDKVLSCDPNTNKPAAAADMLPCDGGGAAWVAAAVLQQ